MFEITVEDSFAAGHALRHYRPPGPLRAGWEHLGRLPGVPACAVAPRTGPPATLTTESAADFAGP